MSAQTMAPSGSYPSPSEPVIGIAGGSPTFARLQARGPRRPMWMTAAPIAVVAVAAGAVIFAISAAPPASNPTVTPSQATAPAAAPILSADQAAADRKSAAEVRDAAPPTPLIAAPAHIDQQQSVAVHRVTRATTSAPRAPAASAQGRDVYATTPAVPSQTVPAPMMTETAPTPDAVPAAPQAVPVSPSPEPQTPPNPN